jgi:biopolymer transport protein TolR
MPAVSQGSRSARGRRRTINEINMVPFIDVMLVLLIIFMVSAPMLTTGLVDLPSVGKSRQQPERVVEVLIAADESLRLRIDGQEPQAVETRQLVNRIKQALGQMEGVPVVISADRQVKYDVVVSTLDKLQRAGIARVGLAVKSGAQR